MLIWVKPDDGFGQSLVRSIKRLLLIALFTGMVLGAALLYWWCHD